MAYVMLMASVSMSKSKNDPYKEGMLCGYESIQNLLSPLKDKLKYDKQKLQKALLKDSK